MTCEKGDIQWQCHIYSHRALQYDPYYYHQCMSTKIAWLCAWFYAAVSTVIYFPSTWVITTGSIRFVLHVLDLIIPGCMKAYSYVDWSTIYKPLLSLILTLQLFLFRSAPLYQHKLSRRTLHSWRADFYYSVNKLQATKPAEKKIIIR